MPTRALTGDDLTLIDAAELRAELERRGVENHTVLDEARAIIHGQRRSDYGGPLESFTRIGRLWAPVLDLDEVTPEQVALCMIGLKVARAMNGFQRDSMVDIAGYAGCIELIQNERDGATS